MNWQYTPYTLPLLISALLATGLILFIWLRREKAGARSLIGAILSAAVWSGAYALEMAAPELADKLLWARFQYIGIVSVPTLWLVFCLAYTRPLLSARFWWLVVEPVVVLALVWTDGIHHLYWRETIIIDGGGFDLLVVFPGLFYYGHVAYAYGALLIGSVLLLRSVRRKPREYRQQFGVLLAGCLAPWIGNALYMSGLSPFPHLDLTPFAFILTGLAGVVGLTRRGLLDLVPVARDLLIEQLSYGIIVLDARQRIVDINQAARKMLGKGEEQCIGRRIEEMLPGWSKLIADHIERGVVEPVLEMPGYICQVSLLSIRGEGAGPHGLLVMLRDIGDRRRQEAEQAGLQRIRDEIWQMEHTDDISRVLMSIFEMLQGLEIFFDHCGINLLRQRDDEEWFLPYSLDTSGHDLDEMREGGASQSLSATWRSGVPSYRPDLRVDDPLEEREEMRVGYGAEIRSVIDVPFSHGTLALNSELPNAFPPEVIEQLQQIAGVLSEAFRRREDIRTREQYLRDLEQEVVERRRTEEELRQARAEAARPAGGDDEERDPGGKAG